MHLTFTISPDRKRLTIHADATARAELRELPDTVEQMEERGESVTIHSDDAMYDAFEHLVCNSELQWIDPRETGDLTDAPILGIYGVGSDDQDAPVSERWGFMDYAVRSPLQDLRDTGRAVFTAP